jgi:hypothetical protein
VISAVFLNDFCFGFAADFYFGFFTDEVEFALTSDVIARTGAKDTERQKEGEDA